MSEPIGGLSQRKVVRPTLREAVGRFEKRFLWTVLYFNLVLAAGTIGYREIEGWSWFDALYMAVITASSVGFSEVHPLSVAGRGFTMVLLAFSLVGLGLLWAMTTALLIEIDLGDVFRKRRTMKRIEALSGHYVVCGAGRMGRVIVDEMVRARAGVLVVETAPDRVARLHDEHPDVPVLEADATLEATLETAGASRAKGLAACLRDDSDNVFLVLTARSLNPKLEIAARVTNEETVAKMRRAGANHVVSPNVTGGSRMAATLLKPSVVSFLDATTLTNELALHLEETIVPAGSHLAGKRLAEARIPQETGLIVLALRHGEGPAVYNPGSDVRLEAGDTMIVLGQTEQIERLNVYALR